MKPVFGYLRVSGKGQMDGDGLERQRQTILEYCAAKGLFVIRWFQDGAVSGTVEAADRQAFSEMFSLAGPATTQIIVVERADRLARTLTVSELACEEARKSGLTILEAASDTDLTNSDDPTRVLIRQVLGALAEWSKSELVMKLAKARARKKQTGVRVEGRRPMHEQRVAVLQEIITEAKERGRSYREIAIQLSKMGVETSQGGRWWSASSVKFFHDKPAQPKNPELIVGLPV